jgi:lipoprotein-anchoring transpeptidase ErfK/SrfK
MNKYLLILIVLLVGCGLGKVVVPPLLTPPVASQPEATPVHNAVTQTALPPVPTTSTAEWHNTVSPMYQEMITKIVVSIPAQRLYAYHGDTVMRIITVSTAAGPTLPPGEELEGPHGHVGHFSVFNKDDNHISGEFGSPMPFAMFFWRGHAIHATEPRFYDKLGTPASHGCVRTTLDNAKWLFERTPLNTLVIVEGPITADKKAVSATASPKKSAQATKPKKRADLSRAN